MKEASSDKHIPLPDANVQMQMKNEGEKSEVTQNKDETVAKFSSVLVSNPEYISQLFRCGLPNKMRSW